MAKSSTRRVTIYINGKEEEASGWQIRAEMNKLVNEQNRMVIGSDEYIAHAKKIRELREYLKEHARNIGSPSTSWERPTPPTSSTWSTSRGGWATSPCRPEWSSRTPTRRRSMPSPPALNR